MSPSNLSNGSGDAASTSSSSGGQTPVTEVASNVTSHNNRGHYNIGVLHSGNTIGREALLKKIGGKQVLHKAVDNFYQRLVTDPQIAVYFEGANLQVLKWHQFNLMSIAFNNVPKDFDVHSLILDKHTQLFANGLDENTYDLVLQHFEATLLDLNVPRDAVQEAVAVVTPLRASFARGASLAQKSRRRQESLQQSRHVLFLVVGVGLVAAALTTTWLSSRQQQQQRQPPARQR
jgi:hemoglobin